MTVTNGRNTTFSPYFDIFMNYRQHTVAKSTLRGEQPKAKRLKRFFKNKLLHKITQSETLRYQIRYKHLSNKTLKDDLSLLRQLFKRAVSDSLIERNPLEGLPSLEVHDPEPNPFTRDELHRTAKAESVCEVTKLIVLLCCYTGLRVSEALALLWQDVDWRNKKLRVERAAVLGQYKRPKTKRSMRTVELNNSAIAVLKKLWKLTGNKRARVLKVLERDKKTLTPVKGRLIFLRSNNSKPFLDSKDCDYQLTKLLKAAGVAHRGINQSRHTFASQSIVAGINLNWIAAQMGHKSLTMIYKHYGRWINEDSADYGAQLDRHFNEFHSEAESQKASSEPGKKASELSPPWEGAEQSEIPPDDIRQLLANDAFKQVMLSLLDKDWK